MKCFITSFKLCTYIDNVKSLLGMNCNYQHMMSRVFLSHFIIKYEGAPEKKHVFMERKKHMDHVHLP